ncbi:hypothetical protein ANTQUA_LOCUS8443, partial [Anthophora quadrimaculata]
MAILTRRVIKLEPFRFNDDDGYHFSFTSRLHAPRGASKCDRACITFLQREVKKRKKERKKRKRRRHSVAKRVIFAALCSLKSNERKGRERAVNGYRDYPRCR